MNLPLSETSQFKVEAVAPLHEVNQDPGNEAQETVAEEVEDEFVSGECTCCMMQMVMISS